jgi:hypothetical protein
MEFSEKLVAPCGMNCGICAAYLRKRKPCPGCRMPENEKPPTRVYCKIKNCDLFRGGETVFCYECQIMPCDRLKHLDKRYRTRYDMSMVENLAYIRRNGLGKFLIGEQQKWKCTKCGGVICVHSKLCNNCGYKINRMEE